MKTIAVLGMTQLSMGVEQNSPQAQEAPESLQVEKSRELKKGTSDAVGKYKEDDNDGPVPNDPWGHEASWKKAKANRPANVTLCSEATPSCGHFHENVGYYGAKDMQFGGGDSQWSNCCWNENDKHAWQKCGKSMLLSGEFCDETFYKDGHPSWCYQTFLRGTDDVTGKHWDYTTDCYNYQIDFTLMCDIDDQKYKDAKGAGYNDTTACMLQGGYTAKTYSYDRRALKEEKELENQSVEELVSEILKARAEISEEKKEAETLKARKI